MVEGQSFTRIHMSMRSGMVGDVVRNVRIVIVEGLKLREVAVERGNVLVPYAPKRADLEDVTFMQKTHILSPSHRWTYMHWTTHEQEQGPEDLVYQTVPASPPQ